MPPRQNFPAYRQLDRNDNIPTCIKILADHYRTGASWADIRSRMDRPGTQGTSLTKIAQALEHHGMEAQWLLCPPNALFQKRATPLIVPWSRDHYVLIHKMGRRKVHLIDPAEGRKTILQSSFRQHWAPTGTGIALAVTNTTTSAHKRPSRPWAALYLPLVIGEPLQYPKKYATLPKAQNKTMPHVRITNISPLHIQLKTCICYTNKPCPGSKKNWTYYNSQVPIFPPRYNTATPFAPKP